MMVIEGGFIHGGTLNNGKSFLTRMILGYTLFSLVLIPSSRGHFEGAKVYAFPAEPGKHRFFDAVCDCLEPFGS